VTGRVKKLKSTAPTFPGHFTIGLNAHCGSVNPGLHTAPKHTASLAFNPALDGVTRYGITYQELIVLITDKRLASRKKTLGIT
jgi:hypothetical protein